MQQPSQNYQYPSSEHNYAPVFSAPIDVAKNQTERLVEFDPNRTAAMQIDIEEARRAKLAEETLSTTVHPLMRLAHVLVGPSRSGQQLTEGKLIGQESYLGGSIFPPTEGIERQFYYVDGGDWFFVSTVGEERAVTRYQVHNNGILKSRDGKGHEFMSGEELETFILATERYHALVLDKIYQKPTSSDYDLVA